MTRLLMRTEKSASRPAVECTVCWRDIAERKLRESQGRRTEQSEEECRKKCMCPMEVDHVAASQKRKIDKLWTRFEEDRHVTDAG